MSLIELGEGMNLLVLSPSLSIYLSLFLFSLFQPLYESKEGRLPWGQRENKRNTKSIFDNGFSRTYTITETVGSRPASSSSMRSTHACRVVFHTRTSAPRDRCSSGRVPRSRRSLRGAHPSHRSEQLSSKIVARSRRLLPTRREIKALESIHRAKLHSRLLQFVRTTARVPIRVWIRQLSSALWRVRDRADERKTNK